MDRALFNLVGTSKATGGGNRIVDGKGRLIVSKIRCQQKTNGPFFIAEFVVESSAKVPVVSLLSGQKLDIEPNLPGSTCSAVIPMNDPNVKSGPGNIKALVLALLGYSEAEVDAKPGSLADALAKLDSKEQPGRGMLLDYETYRKLTKKAPQKEMTLVKWTHVPQTAGNKPEEIKARAAKLPPVQYDE